MPWKILVTAPYMLPVIDQFADIFAAHHIETVCAEVRERLEEEDTSFHLTATDGRLEWTE